MHQLLEWQGPFSWVTTGNAPWVLDRVLPVGALPGVYLWTVPYACGNLIYYVGQTATPLRKRLAAERRKLECGYDYLPDPELLKQGRKTFLYQPRNFKEPDWVDFEARKFELSQCADKLLHTFELFVAHISDKSLRRRIEAALMWEVWDAGDPASNIIANVSWPKRQNGIQLAMNFPIPLLGLGPLLDV